jgi:hypothetical protein
VHGKSKLRSAMDHPLQCRCGTIKAVVSNAEASNRGICYCKDCQAFAHFLGRPQEILDERGGSDVVQILPKNLRFTQGIESLTCVQLAPKGLVRWYASCCSTAIGNTLATPKLSFIGLVSECLKSKPMDESFGPIRMWVNTRSARGEPKPRQRGIGTALRWFFANALKARFNGDYKRTPLFRADGSLIATPRVLSPEEHAHIYAAVRAARG